VNPSTMTRFFVGAVLPERAAKLGCYFSVNWQTCPRFEDLTPIGVKTGHQFCLQLETFLSALFVGRWRLTGQRRHGWLPGRDFRPVSPDFSREKEPKNSLLKYGRRARLSSPPFWWIFREEFSQVLADFCEVSVVSGPPELDLPVFPVLAYMPVRRRVWLWVRLGHRQPSAPAKFVLGLVFLGLYCPTVLRWRESGDGS